MSDVMKLAQDHKDTILADRRFLHTHPGVGFAIEDTLEYVKEQLEQMGYEPERCGRAGLVATVGGKKPGKVFLLRADMDGLQVKEEADVDYPSMNGCMHACGHDMHTAMLLGAARLLKEQESDICGTVKLMFQPAEEIFEGSNDMIQNGLLENPKVDAALMIHVMAGMPFTAGTVIVSNPGVSAPAADYFTITVQGKGCHGSSPNNGVDPITVAAHIITGLQEISARELAISDEAVITLGRIQGGNAGNVIPDQVEMEGTIRTYDEEVREFIKTRLEEMCAGIAASFRAEARVSFGSGCPTLVNDKALAEDALSYLQELLGKEKAFSTAQLTAMAGDSKASKSAGSEDFAYVSHKVPSIMLALAAGQPEKGFCYPQHHPKVKFDEEALPTGAAVYAYTAMRWLEEHGSK